MNKIELIEQGLKKFPKAKRIAVENFTMTCGGWDMAASMNMGMDAASYKWNAHTTGAIRWILQEKTRLGIV